MPEFTIYESGSVTEHRNATKSYRVTAPCAHEARLKHERGESSYIDTDYGNTFDSDEGDFEFDRVEEA